MEMKLGLAQWHFLYRICYNITRFVQILELFYLKFYFIFYFLFFIYFDDWVETLFYCTTIVSWAKFWPQKAFIYLSFSFPPHPSTLPFPTFYLWPHHITTPVCFGNLLPHGNSPFFHVFHFHFTLMLQWESTFCGYHLVSLYHQPTNVFLVQ